MKLVSIIIPVYNVKKHIKGCIESLVKQSYSEIEIILVDDGSTDGSGDECDLFESDNIHIIHKKNEGVSSARNIGIKEAKGDYVLFIDADDQVHVDMVSKMVHTAEIYNADIVSCRYQKKYKDSKTKVSTGLKEIEVFTNYEAIDEINYNGKLTASVCDKLFAKRIVENVEFPLSVRIGEDYTFNIQALVFANKIVAIPDVLYYYIQHPDSVCHRGYTAQSKLILNNYIETYSKQLLVNKSLQKGACAYLVLQEMAIIVSMTKAKTYDWDLVNEVSKEVKKHIFEYCRNIKVPIYLKICALIISLIPKLFIYIYIIFFAQRRKN